MAGGIKGITVEIGGDTSKLGQALEGVNQKTKSLQTELNSINKLLKLDPNNVTLVAQKQSVLKEEISATSEKLKKLKEAQSQVKEQYRTKSIDEGQYREFQREIISTEQQLSKLKEQKSSVAVIGAAFGTVKEKVVAVMEKLAPVAEGLKKVGQAAAGITTKAIDASATAMKVYGGAVAAAGTALTGLAVKSASTADDINTVAAQTGLSTEQIQKFKFATEVIDVPLETVTGSMTKLTKNMATAQKGTGDAANAFKTLGVSITDQNGQLRNNQDVFNEAIAALGNMENETQRDALAMQIFGKSAKDLNPLIKGGAQTLKELGDNAEAAGLIMSQDALDDVNEFRDSLDILQSTASQSGNILGGVFAGSLTQVTDLITQYLPGITNMIGGMFQGVDGANAQARLTSSLVEMAHQLISNFASRLPQFLSGFNAIIISLVSAISTILPEAIGSLLPVLIRGFSTLIIGLTPQVPILLPVILSAALELFGGILTALDQIGPQLLAMLPVLIENMGSVLVQNLPVIIEGGAKLLIGLVTGIANSIPSLTTQVVALVPVITKSLTDNIPALIQAGITLIVALATGLPKAIPAITKALPQIISAIIDGFAKVNWIDVGVQVLKGIAQGLIEGVKSIGSIIKTVAGKIVDGFKSFFGIHSPSTMFRDMIGKNLVKGIAVGFDVETPNLQDTIDNDLKTVSAGIQSTLTLESKKQGGSDAVATGGTTLGGITLHVDKFVNNRKEDMTDLMDEAMEAADEYVKRKGGVFA